MRKPVNDWPVVFHTTLVLKKKKQITTMALKESHPGRNQPVSNRALPTLVIVWSLLVLIGSYSIWSYSATAGSIGDSPSSYPDQLEWLGEADSPLVLMFAHPKCPCTRASITELESIMRANQSQAIVVFWQPENATEDWRETDLIQYVQDSQWLNAMLDVDSHIVNAFDAKTSGMCIVYDNEQLLAFRGGVTPARGHEGDTASHTAIAFALRGEPVPPHLQQYPVYGCAIQPAEPNNNDSDPADEPEREPALTGSN